MTKSQENIIKIWKRLAAVDLGYEKNYIAEGMNEMFERVFE